MLEIEQYFKSKLCFLLGYNIYMYRVPINFGNEKNLCLQDG